MNWTDQAACRDRPDVDFFPVYEGTITVAWKENTAAAKAICASCPVKDACLTDALSHWGTGGIWGGTTELEREKMPKRHLRSSVALCGTDAGYYRHLRITLTAPCSACRAAHAKYTRERAAAKRSLAAEVHAGCDRIGVLGNDTKVRVGRRSA